LNKDSGKGGGGGGGEGRLRLLGSLTGCRGGQTWVGVGKRRRGGGGDYKGYVGVGKRSVFGTERGTAVRNRREMLRRGSGS